MRPAEFGCHVKLKVEREVYHFIPKLHRIGAPLFNEFLLQNAFENGVNCFANIFQQNWLPKLNRVLQTQIDLVCRLSGPQHDNFAMLLHVLYPGVSLRLRVDHERPPRRVLQNYGIIYAEVVVWQLLLICPLPNLNSIA